MKDSEKLEILLLIEKLDKLDFIAPRLPFVISSRYADELRKKGYPFEAREIPPIPPKRDFTEYRKPYPARKADNDSKAYQYEIRHLSEAAKEYLQE